MTGPGPGRRGGTKLNTDNPWCGILFMVLAAAVMAVAWAVTLCGRGLGAVGQMVEVDLDPTAPARIYSRGCMPRFPHWLPACTAAPACSWKFLAW